MDLQRPHHRTALLGAEVVHDITSTTGSVQQITLALEISYQT